MKILLIFVRLLLPYRTNGCAVCLQFSIGTVRPYHKRPWYIKTFVKKRTNDGNGYSVLLSFSGVKTTTFFLVRTVVIFRHYINEKYSLKIKVTFFTKFGFQYVMIIKQ